MSDERPAAGDPLELLPEFHRSTRMPLDAVVRLHFEGTVAYQNGFAANVSALGMFVKHPAPPPIETRLVFEFVLGEERKPVQGAGIVSWVREKYEGPGRPAGVGIRFSELDALSRQHIAEALFEYLESQLGVDVADHPDVPDLLAAVPQRSDVRLDLEPADETAPAPPPDLATTVQESPSAPPAPRFQLFDDALDDRLDETAGEDLFTPVVPPDELPPIAGAGRRRERSRTVPAVLALLAAFVAIVVAWWFLAGPGSVPDVAVPEAETSAAAPPPRPALDPEPGSGRTLAESLGAVEPAPPESGTDTEPAEIAGTGDEPAETAGTGDEPPAAATVAEPTSTAPPAPETPPPAATGERLSQVTDIAWDSAPDGTAVTLIGNGPFTPGSFRWYEMGGDRPRVLVRVDGVASGYPRPAIEVASPELAGIRIGFHQKPAGNELHVVLDLAATDVRVGGVDADGSALVIRLTRSESN